MTVELIDAGRRLRAAALRHAVPRAKTTRTRIDPTAVTISVLQLPGAAAELWGVGIGNPHGPEAFFAVANPQNWESQLEIFRFLADRLAPKLAAARQTEQRPQIVVASDDAWELLAGVAYRMLRVPDDEPSRAAAEAICWANDRHHHPGSTVVVSVAAALAEHFTTGGGANDERSLAWMLAWLDRNDTAGLDDRLAAIEDFDDTVLPLDVEARHSLAGLSARAAGGDSDAAARVVDAATQVLAERHARLTHGVKTLRALTHPRVAAVDELAAHDAGSFAHAQQLADNGWRRRQRLSTRDEIAALIEAEELHEFWHGALMWADAAARDEAEAEGRVLVGNVTAAAGGTITVTTDPDAELRFRPGDTIADTGLPGATYKVASVVRGVEGLTVTLRPDKPYLGVAALGATVTMCAPAPTYDQVERRIGKARGAIYKPGWTHDPKQTAAGPRRASRPGRYRAALEARAT
ncbi:MAG TPA: hypothetical protein VHD87_12990 [Acidimicrobiales bacterium]|nr:hypothetical protein [Acidimicrobiales bacterium]